MAAKMLKDLFKKLSPLKMSRASSSPISNRRSASPSSSSSSSGWHEEDIRRVFSNYDHNGDGKISVDELETMVQTMGNMMTTNPDGHCSDFKAEAAAMMEVADLNGDGFIDFDEFAACICPMTPLSSDASDSRNWCFDKDEEDEALKLAFAVYDQNGDGVITAKELHRVLRRVLPGTDGDAKTLDDCRNMIRAVDRDGDDAVCFQEFTAMMRAAAVHVT